MLRHVSEHKLPPGSRDVVAVLLRVHMRAERPAGDIPQQGHDRNRHNPQVKPCALDRELDERSEEDRKRRDPFHDPGPDLGNAS